MKLNVKNVYLNDLVRLKNENVRLGAIFLLSATTIGRHDKRILGTVATQSHISVEAIAIVNHGASSPEPRA